MIITNCELLFHIPKIESCLLLPSLQLMHLQEWKDRFERLQERFPMLSAFGSERAGGVMMLEGVSELEPGLMDV